MPLITEGVKDIVCYAKWGPFHAQPEDLRLKWIVLGEIPKARTGRSRQPSRNFSMNIPFLVSTYKVLGGYQLWI
jgi:hypothetical protein